MSIFHFKHFSIEQTDFTQKLGTDSMVLGAWTKTNEMPKNVLDIGTGTGALALMMAQKYPKATIDGIELDEAAANQAKKNFSNNALGKKCNLILGDFATHQFNKKYDLIISNPPYFENNYKSIHAKKNLARHTETLPFGILLKKIATLLTENGMASLVFPSNNNNVIPIAEKYLLYPTAILEIYGKPENQIRKCVQFSFRHTDKPAIDRLTIRQPDNIYTAEYKNLTADFHGQTLH
jgi:tRNA1Val (adenine37-N6)-methyltransferase